MAEVGRRVNIVLSLLFVAIAVNADTYYVLDHCSDHIKVHEKGEVKLLMSSSDHISPSSSHCEMYFEAPDHMQLKFIVEDIDLNDCFTGDTLQIFDEPAIPFNAVSNELCKDEGVAFKTTSHLGVVSLYFAPPLTTRPASFRIFVNLYSPSGDCGDHFFLCKEEGYCMSNDLKCEGVCDDDDDDCDKAEAGLQWWRILLICLGAGVIFVVIVVTVVCCVKKKKKKKVTPHRGTAPLSTVAASAPPDPWGFKSTQIPSVPPPSFTHIATQPTSDPLLSYSSSTKDPLPPLVVVPPPAQYNSPLQY